MSNEAGHIYITELTKEVLPHLNWMLEDLFCQYGVNIPYFILDWDFPDYSQRPDWCSGYIGNFDPYESSWAYWLYWFNELLGLLRDEAHLPRFTLPDLSSASWNFFNDNITETYDNVQRHEVWGQSGSFTKDEVVEGQTSGVTGFYKWTDGDGYLHICKLSGNFEDEKIVGQDSGAFAYTYEDYVYYNTYSYSPVDPDQVRRVGRVDDIYYCTAAWPEYQDNPTYDTHYWIGKGIVGLYCSCGGGYCTAQAPKYYLSFDTSGADANPSSAKLRLYITWSGYVDGIDMVLRAYQQDWGDTLDTGDWSGGTFENEITVTTSDEDIGWVEISVDTSRVNIGGSSKYKLNLKEAEEGQGPPDVGYNLVLWITSARLKLGYNE